MGLGDTTGVNLVGDTSGLQDELRRAGIVAGDMSAKIRGSAADAGAAMADLAKLTGASVDDQADAAGRAAAAWTEASSKMTRAQRAAGDAAAKAAKAVGASVDEQRDAYARAIATQAQFEEAQKAAADAAAEAAEKIRGSASMAGAAAADLAAKAGASADEQADAAGRAAAAWTDQAAKMSSAQKAAGDAAAEAARVVGASLDEQAAAYDRSVASVGRYEAAQKAAADVAEESAARQKEAQEGLAEMGGRIAMGVTLGGGLSAYESVKGAMALQSQMERLHTQAGLSQSEVGTATKGVLGMAGQVGESPDQLSQGMYHVVSLMNKTLSQSVGPTKALQEQFQMLRVAAEGAKVGNANLEDVTNAMGAAMVAGIPGVQNYRQAMGAMNATVGAGNMTMQDLSDAFGANGLSAQASMAGLNIKQLGGALAVLGDNTIQGARAGTLLASTLRIMDSPSEAASEALGHIGLSATALGDELRSGGLIGAIELLKEKLDDAGAHGTTAGLVISRAFGGRQSAGVRILLDELDRLKSKTADVGQGMNSFGADVAKNNETAKQQFDELKDHVAALGDEFGMYLIPKLEDVAQETQVVIGWMEKHKAEAEALAAVIAGVLGTAIAAYAYTKAVAFVDATGNMLSAIGSFAKGAASAAESIAVKLGLIDSTAESTSTGFAASTTAMTADADAMETGIATAAEGAEVAVDTAMSSTGIGAILVAAGLAATELATHWQSAMTWMENAVNSMAKAAEMVLNGLISDLNKAISVFNSTIGQLTGDIGQIGDVSSSNVFNTSGQMTAAGRRALIHGSGLSSSAANSFMTPEPPGGPNLSSGSRVSTSSATDFAEDLLDRLGIKPTQSDVSALVGWIQREGNDPSIDHNNPLDTTLSGYGGTSTNSVGVKSYGSYSQGLAATVATLEQANFAALVASLRAGQGLSGAGVAAELSSWSGGGYSSVPSAPIAPIKPISPTLAKYLAQTGSDTYSKAAATSTIPVSVVTMLKAAEALQGTPYKLGGGHGGWDPVEELKKIGLDCSGFVSQVLHAGGVGLAGPQTTLGLSTSLAKGAGQYVTVFDRPSGSQAHTFMEIMGHYFMEGGGANPSQTVEQMTQAQVTQELRGGGFQEYHPVLGGKDATYRQLQAAGLSSSAQEPSVNIAAIVAAYQQSLATAANTLIESMQQDVQNGSIRPLERVLGWNGEPFAGPVQRSRVPGGAAVGGSIMPWGIRGQLAQAQQQLQQGWAYRQIQALGPNATASQISQRLDPAIAREEKGTPEAEKFHAQILALIASGQKTLADKLLQEHKAAMDALAQEIYAAQLQKNAESLTLESTQLKDQTQAMSDAAADQLTISKAIAQKQQDAITSQTALIQDMTQQIQDKWSAATQALADHQQMVNDAASATVQGINDQTQTQVDVLGERGLYGLNLIAQKLQVQLDQQKASDDQAIAVAQQNLDAVTAQWHAMEAAAQQAVDQTTVQQQLLVAAAQQRADQLTIKQDGKIASAQAHSDSIQLAQDINVQLAQTAVDLSANAPKATQDRVAAQLALAQATQTKLEDAAQRTLATVTDAANLAINNAQNAATTASNDAQQAIQTANQTLAQVTGQANYAIQQAQNTLSGTQNAASIAEAQGQAGVSVAQAQAQTEYAGSGMQVNIYGIPTDNATDIASEFAWAARTQLGMAA